MRAPTPDDYRAALALIDGIPWSMSDAWDPDAILRDAIDRVARAAVVSGAARRNMYDPAAGDAMDRDEAVNVADAALDAAVANLIALAKGGAS